MTHNYYCNHKKMKFMAMMTGFALGMATAIILSRKKSGWMNDMRREIMDKVMQTKDMTQDKYNQIINDIRPRYESMKDVGSQEMNKLLDELRSHWEKISREIKKSDCNSRKEDKKAGDNMSEDNAGRDYQGSSNQME